MKKTFLSFCIIVISCSVMAQNYSFNYNGRINPSFQKEKMHQLNDVTDITPKLLHQLNMEYKDRLFLNDVLEAQKKINYSYGNFNAYKTDYKNVVDFLSVEIKTIINGKTVTNKSNSATITAEQKNSMSNADIGSDIIVKVQYKYKFNADKNIQKDNTIKEGTINITVVPENEASFDGGFEKMSTYFNNNIFKKVNDKNKLENLSMAIVHFTINEDGQIVDTKIIRSTNESNLDQLILEATKNMPKWIPAKNANGSTIRQEFNIPLGSGGC